MRFNLTHLAGRSVASNPVHNAQLQDALLTDLVISLDRRQNAFAGDRLFRTIPVDHYLFSYMRTHGEELILHDTERAPRAEIKASDFKHSLIAKVLQRHSWRVLLDRDEVENQRRPVNMAVGAQMIARAAVDLDIEVKNAALVNDAASYLTVFTTTPGQEWNAAGTMRQDVRAGVKALMDELGVQDTELRLFLPGNSIHAAREDAGLLAVKGNNDESFSTLNDVASYLGLASGSVWTANPSYKPAEGAASVQIYNPNPVLYYPGDPTQLRSARGGLAWGHQFSMNQGTALQTWFDEVRTSWSYPWERRHSVTLNDARCAVRFDGVYDEP